MNVTPKQIREAEEASKSAEPMQLDSANVNSNPPTPFGSTGVVGTNMKLYQILVLHGAPKDRHTATETYLAAENDRSVFEWINKEKCYEYWTEEADEGDEPNVRYADGDYEKEIPFREWVMQQRGDLTDEEGWEDAYYGVTKWGWKEVEGATQNDIDRLVALGIAVVPTAKSEPHERQ